MKTIFRLLCMTAFGVFMFSFGNKPIETQPEISKTEVLEKIEALSDSLSTMKSELLLDQDTLLLKALNENVETLEEYQSEVKDAGEAEFFVIRMNCNQIEVWIEAMNDSLSMQTSE